MGNKFDRNRRFFVAVFLAAMFGMKRFTWREIFASLKMLFVAMTSKKGRASDEIYKKRMAACRECPLFYSPLETCGSPLAENPELGCLCFLPRKNSIASATCWANHNTDLAFGWPKELELNERDDNLDASESQRKIPSQP